MTLIDVDSSANLYLLIKDFMLFEFVIGIVVIFGVGYFVAQSVFKR
jgi:hypothetical protein